MRSKIIFLLVIVALASCSSPKYAYYFDHHNYNTVRKQSVVPNEAPSLSIDSQELTASISAVPVVFNEKAEPATSFSSKTYLQMNKAERAALRHHLKREFKSFVPSKKFEKTHAAASSGWDEDLKLAAIFGAVGITGLIIGGNVFNIIGAIAMVIGVVFLVKWIIRQ